MVQLQRRERENQDYLLKFSWMVWNIWINGEIICQFQLIVSPWKTNWSSSRITIRIIRLWFLKLLYNNRQLFTPPQSGDRNHFEHIWAEWSNSIRIHITDEKSLKLLLHEVWNEITNIPDTKTLISSMPRRLLAVIEVKWGPTRHK